MVDETVKAILLEILADLQDLRANQAVLAVYATRPPTTADAEDAKSLVLKKYAES